MCLMYISQQAAAEEGTFGQAWNVNVWIIQIINVKNNVLGIIMKGFKHLYQLSDWADLSGNSISVNLLIMVPAG